MGNKNARLIEKDIFNLLATQAGDSEVINLFGEAGNSSRLSLQAIYDVSSPGAKTFDSGVSASKVIQDLTYTAQTRGTAGNSITVAYTGGGTAGAEVVTVVGSAISVQIESTVSTATQVKTAVDNSAAAHALVSVAISGTGSNAQTTVAAQTFTGGVASEVDVTLNTMSIPTHGFSNGLKVRLTTTGTLPAGLATGTDYFVIVVDADTIQLASSFANAILGTAIDITNQGSSAAVNTVTPSSISGASVTFQKSNDGTNWTDIQAATTITVDGSVLLQEDDVDFRYFKAVKALTAGVVDLKGLILVIGDPE